MGEKRKVALTVNGKRYEEEVEVRVTLADFIRHQLRLTGTISAASMASAGHAPSSSMTARRVPA